MSHSNGMFRKMLDVSISIIMVCSDHSRLTYSLIEVRGSCLGLTNNCTVATSTLAFVLNV